jgi:hypothetical protein
MSHKKYVLTVGLTAGIVLSVLGIAGPASAATTITVCPTGCDSTTIQGAVTAASAGDTISVAAGTYTEVVVINKAGLTLEGAQSGVDARNRSGAETIVTGGQFRLAADDITIDGFTLEASANPPGTAVAAIYGSGFQGTQIINNIVQNNKLGAQFDNLGGAAALIEHNVFKDNDVNVPGGGGTGVFMLGTGSTNVSILDNDFSGDPNAAMNVVGSHITISGNSSTGDATLAVITASSDVTISHNTMTDAAAGSGIFLGLGNDGVTVSDNTLDSAAGPGDDVSAIHLSADANSGAPSTGYTITGNVVTGGWSHSVRESAGTYDGELEVHGNQFSAVVTNEDPDPANSIDATGNWWAPGIAETPMPGVSAGDVCANRDCTTPAGTGTSSSGDPALAFTGVDATAPLGIGGGVISLGLVLLLLAARRRKSSVR